MGLQKGGGQVSHGGVVVHGGTLAPHDYSPGSNQIKRSSVLVKWWVWNCSLGSARYLLHLMTGTIWTMFLIFKISFSVIQTVWACVQPSNGIPANGHPDRVWDGKGGFGEPGWCFCWEALPPNVWRNFEGSRWGPSIPVVATLYTKHTLFLFLYRIAKRSPWRGSKNPHNGAIQG